VKLLPTVHMCLTSQVLRTGGYNVAKEPKSLSTEPYRSSNPTQQQQHNMANLVCHMTLENKKQKQKIWWVSKTKAFRQSLYI